MWVRAVWFEGENEEEGVVPESWTNNGFLFWPPGVDAKKALDRMSDPTSTWRKFTLKKIKFKSGEYNPNPMYIMEMGIIKKRTEVLHFLKIEL